MTTLAHLGPGDLRAVVVAYRDALRAHQEPINRLNVYPVPDGDTGTNMALTMEAVVAELDEAADDMASVCDAIAHGSLMGARGNSGVILCQILRGLATTFADAGHIDGPVVARALASAADAAYQAVGKPVEGTILTVVREAAEASATAAAKGAALSDVLDAGLAQGSAALQRTPELLDVLRQAGVVDAGGAGLLLLFDAALWVVAGRQLPEAPESAAAAGGVVAGHSIPEDGVGDLRYEVMFLLEAEEESVEAFREAWASAGDSIVVVGGDGLWNCHIHTDDIGHAIEAGVEAGRPRRIRVTDLAEEMEEERWVREAVPDRAGTDAPTPLTQVVAVASGKGLRALFETHGAASVVSGGQSMNPSTAELVKAVKACRADQVVILPNNANIVAVAEQVDRLTDKAVRVVPTADINSGLAALIAFDPRRDVEDNAKAMASAIEELVAGEVTRAVRACASGAGPVGEGDWIGIGPAGIETIAAGPAEAAIGLLDALVGEGHELVTIIEGEQVRGEDTERVTAWLAHNRPDVEVEVHDGGQPLYPYLVGIE